MNDLLPPALRDALDALPAAADPCLAGGCVRDWLLGAPVADFDIEVYGVTEAALVAALSRRGRIDAVGRSFGVLKVVLSDGRTHDFSLPRRDSKVGAGHRGFLAEADPHLDPREAASRRDFTVNAMMWNLRRRELWDFFDGRADLRNRILRHTGPAFVEDPLRVLRGMQFAGRFRLAGAPETLELCRGMRASHAELPAERIREEWIKWAAKSAQPSAGLVFLRDAGWLEPYPELAALEGTPQDPDWHPEGDVWTHTLHCLDALVELPVWRESGPERRITLTLAVLLHDCGKPRCTRPEERRGRLRIVSPGHETEGRALAEAFLARLHAPRAAMERVPQLVAAHMVRFEEVTPRAVRRLAHRLAPASIDDLVPVMIADAFGRPPLPRIVPDSVQSLRDMAGAMALQDTAPAPLILGRHLIARGLAPGPSFRRRLDEAFEAQLAGDFEDAAGAASWLDARLAQPGTAAIATDGGPSE